MSEIKSIVQAAIQDAVMSQNYMLKDLQIQLKRLKTRVDSKHDEL